MTCAIPMQGVGLEDATTALPFVATAAGGPFRSPLITWSEDARPDGAIIYVGGSLADGTIDMSDPNAQVFMDMWGDAMAMAGGLYGNPRMRYLSTGGTAVVTGYTEADGDVFELDLQTRELRELR